METRTRKTAYKKTRIALAVLLAILLFLAVAVSALLIACATVEGSARTLPPYAREDISALLAKETLTDADYETLYRQTGLGRAGVDSVPREELPLYQDALFFEGERRHETIAFTTPRDVLFDPETGKPFNAPIVPLEPGDVLLTSVCHTFGWRNGHAALVLSDRRILQSASLGDPSYAENFSSESVGLPWFTRATNFMVLRLKDADADARAAIADLAEERLLGVDYSLVVGIFTPKDQGETPKSTHCSHLVWQAYKYFGYDIDADGGPVCTARDISMSPLFEVVQIYGFDPLKKW